MKSVSFLPRASLNVLHFRASLVMILMLLVQNSSQTFYCENLRNADFVKDHVKYFWVTCYLNFEQTKPTLSFTREQHHKVRSMSLQQNKNISELPKKLFDIGLNNLLHYNAANCSIRSLKRENFEKLLKLQYLNLDYNKLLEIPKDVFVELKALIALSIRKYLGTWLSFKSYTR